MTDLAILPFPALIVWDLQMKLKSKLAVVILFWLRIMYSATYQRIAILLRKQITDIQQSLRGDSHPACYII